jgi:hypothetical protein
MGKVNYPMDLDGQINQYRSVTNYLDQMPDLQFIFRESDLYRALGPIDTFDKVEMAFKKGLLYAHKTIILTNSIERAEKTYDTLDPSLYFNNLTEFIGESDVSRSLRIIADKYKGVADFYTHFCFIPETITVCSEDWDEFDYVDRTIHNSFSFSNEYSNRNGIHVSFSDPYLNTQFFENLKCKNDELKIINICLPHLVNVPFQTMLKIRENESDMFSRFQYALKRFIADCDEVDSENKLKELFLYVDNEVRGLEDRIKKIKRLRLFDSIDVGLGITTVGLCYALLPTDISQIIMAVIGSYQLKDLKDKLFPIRAINDLKASDFYVPWLVGTRSKK